LPPFGEILVSVINDLIGADGADQVHMSRAADAGHRCTERLGNLHCEGSHTSRCPVDQDRLPWLKLSLVAQTLQGGESRHRDGSRLLEGEVVWLQDHSQLGSTNILGKGPLATQTLTPAACGSRRQAPNTSSPGLNCVTCLPTASTWPATSTPTRETLGVRSPVTRRARYGLPLMTKSSGLTAAARTCIKTSL